MSCMKNEVICICCCLSAEEAITIIIVIMCFMDGKPIIVLYVLYVL